MTLVAAQLLCFVTVAFYLAASLTALSETRARARVLARHRALAVAPVPTMLRRTAGGLPLAVFMVVASRWIRFSWLWLGLGLFFGLATAAGVVFILVRSARGPAVSVPGEWDEALIAKRVRRRRTAALVIQVPILVLWLFSWADTLMAMVRATR